MEHNYLKISLPLLKGSGREAEPTSLKKKDDGPFSSYLICSELQKLSMHYYGATGMPIRLISHQAFSACCEEFSLFDLHIKAVSNPNERHILHFQAIPP